MDELVKIITGLGILYIGLGFILTVNNARYLLSGYNTMSAEKRNAFDIKGFVKFFRRFHFFLGISFIVFGILIAHVFVEPVITAFIVGYPVVMYIYLIVAGNRFWRH